MEFEKKIIQKKRTLTSIDTSNSYPESLDQKHHA
jgi:hypothetical protein